MSLALLRNKNKKNNTTHTQKLTLSIKGQTRNFYIQEMDYDTLISSTYKSS